MKTIPLRSGEDFKSRDVIEAVAGKPAPGQGITADEMRRRCRLLDVLENETGDTLQLEDADHALLVRLINAFPFGVAHPKLLAIIDDVVEAKAPEPGLSVVA